LKLLIAAMKTSGAGWSMGPGVKNGFETVWL
jgi:hypothetical protein